MAISIGWPVICAAVLLVAVSMSELTSAFPTAGGPYWWAARLGGAGWSWFTGWFNIVGLLGIVASVGYGAAFFLYALLGLYGVNVLGVNFGDSAHALSETFLLFLIILAFVTALNIFSSPLLALLNNISVGWHVLGVVVIIALLVFVPDHHQNASFVFGHRINNTGFNNGAVGGLPFWFLVLPIGFLLTMYTQTGYDASAHTAEETRGAAIAAAQGVWRSVFFSAIFGWFVLLALLFAANDEKGITTAGGGATAVITTALTTHLWAAKAVIIIATVGQIFCVAAGLTSASRTWYAFSRDRGIPGMEVQHATQPPSDPAPRGALGVLLVARDHDPGAVGQQGRRGLGVRSAHRDLHGGPLHRLHHPGLPALAARGQLRARSVDPGRHYRWINPGALLFVVLVVIAVDLPFSHKAVPWNNDFDAHGGQLRPPRPRGVPDRRHLVEGVRAQALLGPGAHDPDGRARSGGRGQAGAAGATDGRGADAGAGQVASAR